MEDVRATKEITEDALNSRFRTGMKLSPLTGNHFSQKIPLLVKEARSGISMGFVYN
jgi:hypothetical protein